MKTAARISGLVAGVSGLIQLILGVLFWIGFARGLVPMHMLIGLVFVLALMTLCGLGFASGLGRAAVLPMVWSLVVLALGVTQMQLLPGTFHWVIQALHLLVGIAAMGMAR